MVATSSRPKSQQGADRDTQSPFAHLPDQPESLTTRRRAQMMMGRHPPELYHVGMTDEETELRMRLSLPDPPKDDLFARLQALDPSFTDMKTEDLLRELPSKPLLSLYVKSWAKEDDFVRDLMAHFRLVRRTHEIAATLRCVVDTDVEAGAMQLGSDAIRQEQNLVLQVAGFCLFFFLFFLLACLLLLRTLPWRVANSGKCADVASVAHMCAFTAWCVCV